MLQKLQIKTVNNCYIPVLIDSEATMQDIINLIEDYGSYKGSTSLIYKGRILGDNETLSQNDIKSNDVLEITYRSMGGMQIYIKTFSGKNICMDVDIKSTVAKLKEKIYIQLGYPPETQNLIFGGGKPLENNKTLEQYKIPADAAIYIVGRVLGGH